MFWFWLEMLFEGMDCSMGNITESWNVDTLQLYIGMSF